MKVLHITPHLGGGVGSVLRAYFEYESNTSEIEHQVICLDEINNFSRAFLESLGISVFQDLSRNYVRTMAVATEADVVLVHWWNHPLLQNFLMNYEFPAIRLILWSHISGINSPNVICKYVVDISDDFVLTTPLSRFTPSFVASTTSKVDSIDFIWSTIGTSHLISYCNKNRVINVKKKLACGYIGNLDETKLSSDFIFILKELKSLDLEITIIGPPTEHFTKLLHENQLSNVRFLGYVSEEEKFQALLNFDIFIYPLYSGHYGTCDQTIQEAMAFGIPVVTFDNPMERYMIEHGSTGLIAQNKEEFVRCVQILSKNSELRKRMSLNCQEYASKHYQIDKMADLWRDKFNAIYQREKTSKSSLASWFGRKLTPSEIMVESLGIYGEIFRRYLLSKDPEELKIIENQIRVFGSRPEWRGPTKSTVQHYNRFFKDSFLQKWNELINE